MKSVSAATWGKASGASVLFLAWLAMSQLLQAQSPGRITVAGDNSAGQLCVSSDHWIPTAALIDHVVDLQGSFSHTLALRSDGTLWAWGDNSRGQLGEGTTNDHPTPTQVLGLSNVWKTATGPYHSLALMPDGAVWAWGYNQAGELGDGTTTQRSSPVQVVIDGVTTLNAGSASSFALKSDGTVWSWGYNYYGNLGIGGHSPTETPTQVSLTEVVSIAAGTSHGLAAKADGTVWAWGYNHYGQVGDGSNTNQHTPVQVIGIADATSVFAGNNHSFAIRASGTVEAWGINDLGQLGDGTTIHRSSPVAVVGLDGVRKVTGGARHSLAARDDGTLWTWGFDGWGQLGLTSVSWTALTPVQVPQVTGVVDVAGGFFHSLFAKSDGSVYSCGNNEYGQLGLGSSSLAISTFRQIPGLGGITKAAARYMYSVFLGNLMAAGPRVRSVYPLPSGCAVAPRHVMVSYDLPALNVSADDLTISSGSVTSVAGQGRGPYVFSVAGMQLGIINGEIEGDISGAGGIAVPYSWSFTNRAFAGLTGDCTVDALDLEVFQECASGPCMPSHDTAACRTADFDDDGDIDSIDFAAFQRCYGTAGQPAFDGD